MRFRTLSRLHSIFGAFRFAAGIVAAVFGAVLKANAVEISSRVGEPIANLVRWMQAAAWWVIPVTVLAIPALDWLRKTIGHPRVWRVVRYLLDQFREQLFRENVDEAVHESRVTLFTVDMAHMLAEVALGGLAHAGRTVGTYDAANERRVFSARRSGSR